MNLALSGKDKAARVPLNYFRRTSRFKWIITGILVGFSCLGLGVALSSTWWSRLASPGPLNVAHAAWENDCAVCHAPFQPTGSRNALQGGVSQGNPSDALCQHCHQGPPHHANEQGGIVGSCASCHIDHRGRIASLSQPPDTACTRCHSNLDAHTKGGKSRYADHITRLDKDHPQFRLGTGENRLPLGQVSDPGKLKFNHQLHLKAGQRSSQQEAGGWTLAQITDPALRERYRKQQPEGQQSDSSLVQLSCASCHQFDSTDAPPPAVGQTLTARAAGDHTLPVSYEQHCQACHPLTFHASLPDVQIPHHIQPDGVRRFLMGVFNEGEVKALRKKLNPDGRPLPGFNLSLAEADARKRSETKVKALENILYQDEVNKAEQFVFSGQTTCGLCHYFDRKAGELIPTRILPTNVPQVWYPHGKFSHRAHRAVSCESCHEGANNSTKHTDVLLPGVENCRTCHAPAQTVGGELRGGVRSDCSTCHLYHQDNPLGGQATSHRGVKAPQGIQEFLRGKAK